MKLSAKMKKLKALEERLAALRAKHATRTVVKAATTSVAAPDGEDGDDGDATEAPQVKALTGRIKLLEEQVRARPSLPKVEVIQPNGKNFSFVRTLIKSQQGLTVFDAKGWEDAPNELAVLRQGLVEKFGAASWGDVEAVMRLKALSLSSTVSAGGLIPHTLMQEIIPQNRSQLFLDALGVRRLPGLVGSPVEWNRKTGGVTFRPLGENPGANATADDLTYTQVQVTPHEFIGLVETSNRLLNMNPGLVESEIRSDLGEGYERAQQIQLLTGSGIGGNCRGLFNRDTGTGLGNVNTLSFSGDAIAAALPKFWALRAMLAEDNNPTNALKWLMHPNDLHDIQKAGAASTTSAPAGTAYPPLFTAGDPSKGIPDMVYGMPVVTSTDCTEGTIALGHWPNIGVASWSGAAIAMSSEAGNFFHRGQTGIRLIFDMDVALWQPSSFATGTTVSV